MISYICLLATVFANLSCADDMDNSKFDNMIPYGKQEVSYTYPKGEGSLRVLTFNIRHCAGNDDVINYGQDSRCYQRNGTRCRLPAGSGLHDYPQ